MSIKSIFVTVVAFAALAITGCDGPTQVGGPNAATQACYDIYAANPCAPYADAQLRED